MILGVTISLDVYCNIRLESDNFPTIKECALQILKSLAKLPDANVKRFIDTNLIPLTKNTYAYTDLTEYIEITDKEIRNTLYDKVEVDEDG